MPWQKAADDSSSNVSDGLCRNLSQSGENALSLEFDSGDLYCLRIDQSECTKINLSGSGATVSGSGVTVENGNITVTSAGKAEYYFRNIRQRKHKSELQREKEL